jgi:phenylacetate-CoA ligase
VTGHPPRKGATGSNATARRLGIAPPEDLLDSEERMSVDELRALQLQRLQWTLHHAYDNVALYRRKFDTTGVHPDDCRELADLAKFPFITKADLRESYPFGMFAVPRQQDPRSSGTTGKPTVVGYTAQDIES